MSGVVHDSPQIWSLSDTSAGNRRQSDALAGALAPDAQPGLSAPSTTAATTFASITLATRMPWRLTAPRVLPSHAGAFGADFASVFGAGDASAERARAHAGTVAVGCGRQAALATRWLKHSAGTRGVQILDPRIDPSHWDLVITPAHDGLEGGNVITTLGSLHPVDDAWLARARGAFPEFEHLPRPRTALLLGGRSAHARFDLMAFEVLASKLEVGLARDGGSLLVTTSRRTPRDLRKLLAHRYDGTPGVVWRTDADGPNPYAGLLAWADRIVCSPDSVNMVSEACATRVPVYVFDPGRVRGRPRRFLDALLASGRIRALQTSLDDYAVEPLRETERVAREVRERLRL